MQPGEAEIAVTPASLLAHAGHVEAAADAVEVARAAAADVRLASGAYGLMCGFVPVYLNGLSDGVVAGLDGPLTSLRDTGARLRATAAIFDEANAGAAQQVRAPLDGADPFDRAGFVDRTSLLDPTVQDP